MGGGMKPIHEKVLEIVQSETPRLRSMEEKDVSRAPAPDKWCKKEILGHLIDSACNNHQRFVRALLADGLDFPGYSQNAWVRCQGFAEEGWEVLVDLWCALNRHLYHIIKNMPKEKLAIPCRIGGKEAISLEKLIQDYVSHMEHHLVQIDPCFAPEAG
jgi:hypothetical protein